MGAGACYHCGDTIPPGAELTVTVAGEERPVCCHGCRAVAALIADSGLTDFYRYRTGPSPTPEPEAPEEWRVFDRDSVRASLVRECGDGMSEVVLGIEGLYCAACAWLIEHVLQREPGVSDIQVNPATGRALLRWDASRAPLSRLLHRVSQAGYRPHPLDPGEAVPGETRERRAALRRLSVAGLGMMQVMMYAVGLYAGAIHEGMDPGIERFLRLVSLLVATPVVFYAGAPFFRGAWRDLVAGRPGMDVPVSLAVGGAYAASVWHVLVTGGEVYFDSVTMFVFFLSVARFLEMSARQRAARSTAALARSLPETALRLEGGRETRVPLAEIGPGDRLRVRVGDPVPADGTVVRGESRLDESLLTGEFMPVTRGRGDDVIAGSLNQGAPFELTVTRTGGDTMVSSIARMLERAQAERPPLARLADRVARWFVAGVLAAAAATALAWWLTAPGQAFAVTLAVLVVTCPCALSLATPTALVAATAALARQGVLVTRAGVLETLARADRVVFDKTGTLTRGRLTIRRVLPAGGMTATEAGAMAAALEAHSEHPIARAFQGLGDGRQAAEPTVHRGLGIEGIVEGRRLRLGRPDWAADGNTPPAGADTVVALGEGGRRLALFHLADEPRAGAAGVIRDLRDAGLPVAILSGDAEAPVAALAGELGVTEWYSGQRPEDKLARLRDWQAAGQRVVMVGDGINDAPVLAGADVSVAMGSGSALAHRSADMLLAGAWLPDLLLALRGARRTLTVVRQNLAWALAYNACALPLAMAGLVAPWMAALGMSASSLVVVANAARLARGQARPKRPGEHGVPQASPRAA